MLPFDTKNPYRLSKLLYWSIIDISTSWHLILAIVPVVCGVGDNYVNPGCGRSRRPPDLEVSIAPGRRAEILIAVTSGGYCLTRVCSRSGHTICRGAPKQLTNTIPLSLQRSHSHLNSIFASKLHARDPLHWVICIRLIRWHGAHLQAVVIAMEILLPDPEKLP